MEFWRSTDKQAAYSRLLSEIAGNEAIREAEQVVGGAWLATLAAAEEEAATARKVCTHIRDKAYEALRAAEADRDQDRINVGNRELAASQRALVQIRGRHEAIRRFTGQENAACAAAARTRSTGALADKQRLVEAANDVGLDVDPFAGDPFADDSFAGDPFAGDPFADPEE
jgi:hypothetical protein